MNPLPHQLELSEKALPILKEKGLVFLCMQERVGKSLIALLIAEKCKVENVLIITKKKAIAGWKDTLCRFIEKKKDYEVINYESIHKLDKKDFGLVIIDESHYALSGFPKPSKTFKLVKGVCKELPCIFLSATPSSQSYSQLFHQLNVTKYSPFFKYPTFYNWFKDYGIPEVIYLGGRSVQVYNNIKEEKIREIKNSYFISYTRKEAGFKKEPQDTIHYVNITGEVKGLISEVRKNKILKVEEEEFPILTMSKELTLLHQIEGSTIKVNERNFFLKSVPKVDYILDKFGDLPSIGIFYHFQNEEILLKKYFRNANLYQGSSYAEGVDLSHLDTLIIYSMDYSASKYTQRRARQCNFKRDKDIEVHYLLVKGEISELVYNCVAKDKRNFTEGYYKEVLEC